MRWLAAALIVACTTATALADGKMFWREKVPPSIPYQRALILYRDGTETLVLQSRYAIPEAGEKTTLGWVVPVPAVPEIASMPADKASRLFMFLSMSSRPRVTSISTMLLGYLFLAVFAIVSITSLLCIMSFVVPMPSWFKDKRGKAAGLSIICLFLWGLLLPSLSSARGSPGVDVISEQCVGIYDVRVVRSDDSSELVSWLNSNSFTFSEQDATAFRSYVSNGWCFVVATINPTAEHKDDAIVTEGLAAPLVLRFQHASPVYPLALTSTGGHETEILIYLASAHKMSAGENMTLRYAGPWSLSAALSELYMAAEPKGFFAEDMMEYPFLCKFKANLLPDQMRKDLVFRRADDDAPYREHIVRW